MLFIISCDCNQENDYDIINNVLKSEEIRLENLSNNPYYFVNALYDFNENEFKSLGFDIGNETKYKIDNSLIKNKFLKKESICETRISKPLFSKDEKKALIAIEEKRGCNRKLIIYLLYKNKCKWIVKTNIKAETICLD